MFDNVPILSIVAYVPLLGALIVMFFMKSDQGGLIRKFSTGVVVLDFLLSLPLWFAFNRDGSGDQLFQFHEGPYKWIESIGVHYEFGIDGIALLLVLLTTLLGVLAFLSSWGAIRTREKEYYIFLLLLQTGMLGVFMRWTSSCSTSSGKSCWCRCTSSSASGAARASSTHRSSSSSTPWWARC